MGIDEAGPGLLREGFRAAAVRDLFVGGLQGFAGVLRRPDERLRPQDGIFHRLHVRVFCAALGEEGFLLLFQSQGVFPGPQHQALCLAFAQLLGIGRAHVPLHDAAEGRAAGEGGGEAVQLPVEHAHLGALLGRIV